MEVIINYIKVITIFWSSLEKSACSTSAVTLQIRYDFVALEVFIIYHNRPLSTLGVLGKEDRGGATRTLGVRARMFKP